MARVEHFALESLLGHDDVSTFETKLENAYAHHARIYW
jgi:hypothetical protein